MNLFGVGVDIVDNSRIKKMIRNKDFLNRVFSNYEILNSTKIANKTAFFAKRFAAKEAFSKSLGTGFRNNLNFRDIVIKNNKSGKPFFLLQKKLNLSLINNLKLKSLISIYQFLMKRIILQHLL